MVFWKKSKQEKFPGPALRWVGGKMEKVQGWWVALMVRLTAKLSLGQQKIGCLLLGLLCFAYCTFLLLQGFSLGRDEMVPVGRISRPESPHATPPHKAYRERYPEEERLLFTLDSVMQDKEGKRLYDSIVRERPGLPDTIRMLKEYYKTE